MLRPILLKDYCILVAQLIPHLVDKSLCTGRLLPAPFPWECSDREHQWCWWWPPALLPVTSAPRPLPTPLTPTRPRASLWPLLFSLYVILKVLTTTQIQKTLDNSQSSSISNFYTDAHTLALNSTRWAPTRPLWRFSAVYKILAAPSLDFILLLQCHTLPLISIFLNA